MRTLSLMFFRSISSNLMASGGQSLLDWTSRWQLRSLEAGRLLAVSMAFSSSAFHLLRSRENLLIWFIEYRRRAALDSFLLSLISRYIRPGTGSEYVAGSIYIYNSSSPTSKISSVKCQTCSDAECRDRSIQTSSTGSTSQHIGRV